jgi:hypothetical protein
MVRRKRELSGTTLSFLSFPSITHTSHGNYYSLLGL